jgi:hypothetical protein
MIQRKQLFSFLSILSLVATSGYIDAGCSSAARPVEIADITKNPSLYNNKIVTIHACYYHGKESTVMQSCTDPRAGQLVHVISYREVESNEKAFPKSRVRSTGTEYPSAAEEELYAKLSTLPDFTIAEVTVRGEFKYSQTPQFGHDPPGYSQYQLILYRVLRSRIK